jgi:hypothetical protein
MLLTGQPADIGVMDITQLRGISRTAPYFHNNSAATLEEVLDHYTAFFARVARVARQNPPPNLPPIISSNGLDLDRGIIRDDERAALLAYLRKLSGHHKGLLFHSGGYAMNGHMKLVSHLEMLEAARRLRGPPPRRLSLRAGRSASSPCNRSDGGFTFS